MVSRPLASRTPHNSEPTNSSSPSRDGADDEENRLTQKFAAFRYLVPLTQNPDVLFLNAASAPPSNLVVHEAITKYSSDALYAADPHAAWRETREEARGLIARCINAENPRTLAFTRDTTEGLGGFVRALAGAAGFGKGDNVVLLDNEHPNMVFCWLALRESTGIEVRIVPTVERARREGRVRAVGMETLRPYVDARTRAVGISSVSFDAGQVHDVQGICAELRPRGVHVLADVSQHVGIARLDVREMGVSAAAFSLHKGLNCPTGVGALYVSPRAFAESGDLVPPVVNMAAVGNMRESLLVDVDQPVQYFPDARRFEHQNMSLVGVAAAAAFTRFYLEVLGPGDVEGYLYYLTGSLRRECEALGIRVVGPVERRERAPHICVLDLDAETWGPYLAGFWGARFTVNRLGIRVSFGFFNSVEDVRRFVRVLELGVERGLRV
ncbi:PLP-dependent transferase [Annulohypoxylon truncatum]|uniref:PLP-dependent transferase n=1 Tax=Annulohypoxylon truncatum TaxID=327061 RepID=UPI002007C98E|nr:PLP-dependent transferase [Annulohypoxylon truncatum]KAI1207804.1 PLP-dependent transferase [Annulohypoxylon truncatum]